MKKIGCEQNNLLISVIIPTRNGAKPLRELLAALTIQSVVPDEILIIDSTSTDASAAVAEEYGAVVQIIAPESFDHGGTRSQAARSAHGDILVFFTQDAMPAHRRVLERLIAPLRAGTGIVATYGRQLPAFNADEIAAHLRLFNYPNKSVIRSFADRHEQGFRSIFISNSCAAYLRNDLAEIDFFADGLIFGEDTCAAAKLLEKGGKIQYVADAQIYHSHNYSRLEEFRRYFDIGVLHESENRLVRVYGNAAGQGMCYLRSGVSYLWGRRSYSLIIEFVVRVALKFLGYQLGRRYRILPRKIVPELSMHRGWWNVKAASRRGLPDKEL